MLDRRTQIAAMVLSGAVSDPGITNPVRFALITTDELIKQLDIAENYASKIATVSAAIKTVMAGSNMMDAQKRDEMARLIVQQLFNPVEATRVSPF